MTVDFSELSPPYSTIVADPPWHINKVRKRTRPNQVDMDYSMMSLDEIKAMPVADLAADVATLFVWTIDRYLYDTPSIVEAWGFKYHLTMAWDKTNGMAMFGFNRQTEFVVVGFRGPHDAYPDGPVMRSSFTASVGKAHSVKPDCFMDAVEARFPGPYVELFCRRPRFGWDSWGKGYEISDPSHPGSDRSPVADAGLSVGGASGEAPGASPEHERRQR